MTRRPDGYEISPDPARLDVDLVHGFLITTEWWEPDAPRHRATLAPQLPPDWDRVKVSRLRVGETELGLDPEIAREILVERIEAGATRA